MRVKQRSYNPKSFYSSEYLKEAEYIHSYYLPLSCRNTLKPQDVAVIYAQSVSMMKTVGQNTDSIRNFFNREPFTIYYEQEGLLKEISARLLGVVVTECVRYFHDTCDKDSLSCLESLALFKINQRLRGIEQEISREFKRMYLDWEAKQILQEPVPFNSVEFVIQFDLAESDSMYCDENGKILHEYKIEINMLPETRDELDRCCAANNTHLNTENSTLCGSPQCHLFLDLVGHSKIPLKHFSRIGNILLETRILSLKNIPVSTERPKW